MPQLQHLSDYSGSVYGGLGQLLLSFSQAKNIPISAQLRNVQQLERFDFAIWRDLLNEIFVHIPSPTLGLEIAEYVEPRHLGILAYIAMSCENLAEAVQRYYDFHRLIYDGSPLQIDLSADHIQIRWRALPSHLATPLTDEIAIAILARFLKQLFHSQGIQLHQVNFSHVQPKHVQRYHDFFCCPVVFSQPHSSLVLSKHVLQQRIIHADQTLQHLLMQQAQALLKQLPHSTQLDERLQQSILIGLQKNNYQIENIAAQLSMSVRQLQRYLQSQNTSYQQRVQQIRHMLALQYLQDPHLSLHEIALLLSYSEQSAFQRAFKQWTGKTPKKWRKQIL